MPRSKKTVQDEPKTEAAKGRIDSYDVKESEENMIHVELEKVKFDPETGEKQSRPFVQIYDPQSWNRDRTILKNLGYNYIKVLHAPKGTNLNTDKK